MRLLFHNATQKLSDMSGRVSSHRFFVPIVTGILLIISFIWAWCLLFPKLGSYFSQDSYAYYLIGKNIFRGLGYTTDCARDLSVPPVWPVVSKSFPPLHPLLVGFADFILGLKIRSASAVSLLYLGGTLVATLYLGRELEKRAGLFVFFAFIATFALNGAYREELEGGRSIPGMMIFFLLLMLFHLKTLPPNPRKRIFEILSGVCAGAMLLQRFDQTLFSLVYLFLCFFIYRRFGLSKSESLKRCGLIVGAFTLTVLPWAIRNTVQFGAPFASDNTASVFGTFRGLACCAFRPHGYIPQTIFTDPEVWLNQKLGNLSKNLFRILAVTHYTVLVVPAVFAAMWKTFSPKQRLFALTAFIHLCMTLLTISLTPYGDRRYFSLVHLNTLIVAAFCAANLFELKGVRTIRGLIQAGLVVFLFASTFSATNLERIGTAISHKTLIPQNPKKEKSKFTKMERVVRKHVKKKDTLVVKPNADGYTAFTGRRTVYFPSTIHSNRRDFAEWLKAWSIDFLLVPKNTVTNLRLDKFVIDEVSGRKLVDANAFLKSKWK